MFVVRMKSNFLQIGSAVPRYYYPSLGRMVFPIVHLIVEPCTRFLC